MYELLICTKIINIAVVLPFSIFLAIYFITGYCQFTKFDASMFKHINECQYVETWSREPSSWDYFLYEGKNKIEVHRYVPKIWSVPKLKMGLVTQTILIPEYYICRNSFTSHIHLSWF